MCMYKQPKSARHFRPINRAAPPPNSDLTRMHACMHESHANLTIVNRAIAHRLIASSLTLHLGLLLLLASNVHVQSSLRAYRLAVSPRGIASTRNRFQPNTCYQSNHAIRA